MERFRKQGDRWGASECGQVLGYVQSMRGEHRAALATYAEAAKMAAELDATGDLCLLKVQSAWEHEFLGESERADRLLEETEGLVAVSHSRTELRSYLLLSKAEFARRRHDLAAAERLLEEGRQSADRGFLGPFRAQYAISGGYLALERGEFRAAVGHFRQGLEVATRFFYDRPDVAYCVEGLAAAVNALGDPRTAAVLLGGASLIRPTPPPAARHVDGIRIADKVRGALAPDEYERAFAEGRALSADEALALAREQAEHLAAP
jgi:tetratricopeptide (TPR) repeat protein